MVSRPSLCSNWAAQIWWAAANSVFELLLGTWPSACYQREDVLSAFELLLGTWPSACYQRVDVPSQLLGSSLHVGFRNYQSSPTLRARTENEREVSEGSMLVTDTLGSPLLVLMPSCKTRKTFTSTRGRTGEYSSPAPHVRVEALGATFVWLDAWVLQRTQPCGRTAGDIVSTAVGIIQYWKGTPHHVLISVLLYSDRIYSSKIFL